MAAHPLRANLPAVQSVLRIGQCVFIFCKFPYSILQHARIFRPQRYLPACQPRGACAGGIDSRLCVGKGGRSLLAVGGEKSWRNDRQTNEDQQEAADRMNSGLLSGPGVREVLWHGVGSASERAFVCKVQ